MPKRRLLLLDANRLSTFAWQGSQITQDDEFASNPPGLEAFTNYLKKYPQCLFYLLADVSEEGFQIDDVPYVTGRDRAALLKRRLGQYYYGSPYSTSISLGRSKTGRRDEKVLFAALTRPPHIDPWINCFSEAASQLAGLYTMPLVVARLFAASKEIGSGRHLLLTMGRGGLRQTFFDAGQFRFSRLTPLATGSIDEFAVACRVEAEKIYQYLVGQRLIERGTRLESSILLDASLNESFRERCHDTAEIGFGFIDLGNISRARGLKGGTAHKFWSDELFLHAQTRGSPGHQLAPESLLKNYRLWQIKTAINATSMIGFSACALLALRYGVTTYSIEADTLKVQADTSIQARSYETKLKALPPMPMKAEALRSLIDRYAEMEKRSPRIKDTLSRISRGLDLVPETGLQSIAWNLVNKPEGASSPAYTVNYFAVSVLQAELVVSMASDHRTMLVTVEKFATELRKDSSLDVKLVRLPFDTESGKTIRSSASTPATQVEPPTFAIRILQRIF